MAFSASNARSGAVMATAITASVDRPGIEQACVVFENILTVGIAEGLASQAGDALVIAPRIVREARIHRAGAGPGEEAGRQQLNIHIRLADQSFRASRMRRSTSHRADRTDR